MDMDRYMKHIKSGEEHKVTELIRKGLIQDVSYRTTEGHFLTPVAVVVLRRQLKILHQLLESGFSPNAQGRFALSDKSELVLYPLTLACKSSHDGSCFVKLLIEYGARVDYPMYEQFKEITNPAEDYPILTPFLNVLHKPRLDYIETFLDAGVDPLMMHTAHHRPLATKARREFYSESNRKVNELEVINYLIFHLQRVDRRVLEVLLNAGGIVPETREPVMHSILFRYLLYASQHSNLNVRMVEVLLYVLLQTSFMFRHEEFIALLYSRYLSEITEHSTHLPSLVFSPCNPDTSPIYINNREVLLSVDELFVNTMWNLKIYVSRLDLTPGFLSNFFGKLCRPKTLKNACRLTIRRTFGRFQLKTKIDELPLPGELKKYVYELGHSL